MEMQTTKKSSIFKQMSKPKLKILFLHGFMGSALNWGRIRGDLEKSARENGLDISTHAFDLLGHANNHPSKDTLDKYSNFEFPAHEALCDDLLSQITKLGEGPLLPIGHSFGLRPLLHLLKKDPQFFNSIIVEDSSPYLSREACAYLFDILQNTPVPFRTREDAKFFFDSKFGLNSVLSRFLLSNVKGLPEGPYQWRFHKEFLYSLLTESQTLNYWNEWKAFQGELVLIYGENSPLITEAYKLNLIKERMPRSLEVKRVKGAAHWVHSDKPESFVETLMEVLKLLKL